MKTTRLSLPALLGGITLATLSCGDPSPTGVGARGPALHADLLSSSSPLPSGLLGCSPLPYDSVTQTIGPEGGALQVGKHVLSVPPMALDSAVTITAVAPSETTNQIRFHPEGLAFQRPASLTMDYANCNLLGLTLPKRIAYVDGALAIREYLPSLDILSSQEVTGLVRHFSTYAVAW
ncbi:MAG: hypothetical protein ACREMJ_06215 [Gemmatimonadales bacterium]